MDHENSSLMYYFPLLRF